MIRWLGLVFVFGLVGCGGSGGGDDSADDTTNDAVTTPVEPISVPIETVETPTDSTPVTPAPTPLFGPAQVILAECGSLEVAGADANNTTPTEFFAGQLVQGQLLEDSPVLDSDLWRITLEPGNYHLIADIALADGSTGTTGLQIDSVTADGDERILSASSGGEFDVRGYEYLAIDVTTTFTLRVTPVFDEIQTYQMAIIPNGTAVPSPRFTLCPAITPTSLDTTQTITEFSAIESIDDFRWFSVDVPAGLYSIDATGTVPAVGGVLAYSFDLFERFGEVDTNTFIGGTSSATTVDGPVLSETFDFTASDNAVVWIRAGHRSETINLELTISEF